MIIADLPEKTRRHLELEYSFNTSPDDKTKSALAQLTGLAIEEVSEWFERKRQKGERPGPVLSLRDDNDRGTPRESTTAQPGNRQILGIGEPSELPKEVQGKGQYFLPWSDSVDTDKVLDTTSLFEDHSLDNWPIVLPRVRDYTPRSLDFTSKGESQGRQNSIPNHTSAIATSQSVIPKNINIPIAVTKINHSSDGITTGDESSLPGVSVFKISDDLPPPKSLRSRRRYTEEERRQVADTRKRGACENCKALRTKVSELSFL